MLSVSTLKKIGLFAGGVLCGDQGPLQQRCKEGLYKLYGGCSESEGLRDEDCDYDAGERRRHPGRGAADQCGQRG